MCDVVQLLVLIMRNFKLSSPCVTLKFMYMFGLNLSFVFCFLNWFQFYLPLLQIYGNKYMRKESKN